MEVHKAKPIHRWRDVLKEWGIIVLGVLTALAIDGPQRWLIAANS